MLVIAAFVRATTASTIVERENTILIDSSTGTSGEESLEHGFMRLWYRRILDQSSGASSSSLNSKVEVLFYIPVLVGHLIAQRLRQAGSRRRAELSGTMERQGLEGLRKTGDEKVSAADVCTGSQITI